MPKTDVFTAAEFATSRAHQGGTSITLSGMTFIGFCFIDTPMSCHYILLVSYFICSSPIYCLLFNTAALALCIC